MVKVKKAYFPFNIILWVFFIVRHNKPYHEVAMIDPFLLNILTIGDDVISESMYKHELCHIKQIKRDGRLKFICKYLYYCIKHGYTNNPYEVEARAAATK